MKTLFLTLSCLISLSYSCQSLSDTVYVTETGKRYHTEDCWYLKYSKREVTLKEAQSFGYTPCKVCKPKGKAIEGSAKKAKRESSRSVKKRKIKQGVTSTRCRATTQKGSQCKR